MTDTTEGDLIGRNDAMIFFYSYWDIETSKIKESDGGTGLMAEEMTSENASNNMEGFDFDEI